MTKTKIGKIPVYKGEYDNNTIYNRLNQVTYLGTTFLSTVDDNLGHPPAEKSEDEGEISYINTNYWDIIAKGVDRKNERAATSNNKGYKILNKNKTFKELITEENTIYEIRYNYNLNGETVTIPLNCILKFEGGILSNGNLVGLNTSIITSIVKIFSTLKLSGIWNTEFLYSEWFGAIGNLDNYDDSIYIQEAIDNASNTNIKVILLLNKIYYLNTSLKLNSFIKLLGIRGSVIYNLFTKLLPKLASINAIEIVGTSAKNLVIKDIEIVGLDKLLDSYGIFIYNEKNIELKFSIFENITITNFKHGIHILFTGNSYMGFSSNKFIDIATHQNKIGIYIDGNYTGLNSGCWMNCNYFIRCHISYNTIGGCLIKNMRMFTNNIFDLCLIEGNGREYNLDDYSEGIFGIKLINPSSTVFEGNILLNSYLEKNFPQRQSNTPLDSEILENNICYPSDVFENTEVGTIIIHTSQLDVVNCTIVNSKNLIILSRAYVSIKDNCYNSLPAITSLSSNRNFIEITESDYIYLYTNNNKIKTVSGINQIYAYSYGTIDYTKFTFIKNDETSIKIVNGSIKEGNLYMNGSDTKDYGVLAGLSPQTPMNNFLLLVDLINRSKNVNSTIMVELLGDTTVTNLTSGNYYESVVPSVIIKSSNNSKITFNSGIPIRILFNIKFKYCTIYVESGLSYIIGDYNNFVFEKCTISFNRQAPLFASGNYNLTFNNCTFEWVNNYFKFILWLTSNFPNIVFNNCNYSKSSNSVVDLYISFTGSSVNRHKYGYVGMKFFDTTLNKPIYVKSVDDFAAITLWVDAAGSNV